MEKRHIFDKPKNVKRLLHLLYAICGLVLAIDLVHDRHILHAWEKLFGFYGVYGFVGCAALVLVAKQLRKIVMRDEDYYDR